MPIDPNKLNKPTAKPQPQSQHSTNAQAATSAMTSTANLVSGQVQRSIGNAQAYFDRVEEQRDHVLEKLSDRAAYLLDERTFTAELLQRTAAKLGAVEAMPENPFDVAIEVPKFNAGSTSNALPLKP
ncbi:MAG TPA: hypothetical protein V6D10_05860 [Trichocoleus sp.]|jgi:hypothetical protein